MKEVTRGVATAFLMTVAVFLLTGSQDLTLMKALVLTILQ